MEENKALVVKANDLIEGFTDMTQIEYKFTLYLISKIEGRIAYEKMDLNNLSDKDIKNFQIQTVTVKEFAELIAYKGNSIYEYVENFQEELAGKTIKVRVYTEKGYIRRDIPWFGYMQYEQSEAKITVTFNEFLIPYLLKIDVPYTKYFLSNVKHMDSVYSIKMFELLKQYEKIGWRKFEVEELRQILEIKPNEYKNYFDFKKNAILRAQKEIREKTDITFEFDEEKRGKKIVAIRFSIKTNKKDESYKEDLSEKSNEIKEITEEFKRLYNGNLLYVDKMIDKKGLEHVRECLKNFKDYITSDVKAIEKMFYAFVMDGENWVKPTAYRAIPTSGQVPSYANFEQREYDEKYYEKFYANLKDEPEN
jgi:plasmid replication initiation protein